MENLLDNLKILLQKDERLTSEGELLKNKVIELAIKLDKDLIELLLSDEQMKEIFFIEVGNATIFDKDKFIRFVSNKQFLPDSYTAFKNKIGLIDEKGEFISEKKEVVLSWPYKDCILEGGMTKEDQKRDEIFWNEILAPDEISRLFDPKVFTNAKRIDTKGEHKFDGFRTDGNGDIKDNLIIKGNNLLALHSLKKRFAGKVKLIYIDPPYNTGGEANIFTYNNSFNHSTWLTFMKNRLEIAKEFLRKDGFITIAIDHYELLYLGVLADEIFGRDNRIGIITIVHHPAGKTNNRFFATTNEYLLVYAKDKESAHINLLPMPESVKKSFKYKDEISRYKLENLMRKGETRNARRQDRPNQFYPIYVSKDLKSLSLSEKKGYLKILPIEDGKEWIWSYSPESLKIMIEKGEVIARKNKNNDIKIYFKRRITDYEGLRPKTTWIGNRYNATFYGTTLLKNIIGEKVFSYPKSLYAVLDIINITTDRDDIILDFFAGSGTTAHAVLELNKEDDGNRRFILVEQLEEHIKVCKERIQKVLQKENIKDDFVYLELMKWNQNFVEKIQKVKTKPSSAKASAGKQELKKLWETMKKKAFLSYKVDVKTIDEHAKDFEDLSIEDQKKFLLECLDKNHLYVNYSEIDDEEYGFGVN